VLRLTTRVISVKELPAGHGVSYGLTFTTENPRWIAVVAIGYNDGYPWALSNKGWMALHRQRCPVVGRVCMDVTMIDVTELIQSGGAVNPGDEVIVLGPDPREPSLLDLAQLTGTITYEFLTRISPRVRRIYRASHG
jgi:alanine racemase